MMSDQPINHLDSNMMLADDALLTKAANWHSAGQRLALAFVIHTWGSSPRQVGSLMLIREDSQIAGSVSGGCVEGAVIDAALEIIKTGGSQRLDFGVADATAWEVGLSCGGKISVLVMAVTETGFSPALLADAAKSLAQRLPVGFCLPVNGEPAQHAASLPATSALVDDEFWFVQAPRPQIIIIGAVHISQHLASMATQSGFDVTVIDPRRTFATVERFSGIKLVSDWPDRVLGKMVLDQETALVALTHDPKIDDAALHLVLGKPLFHIACLGSRRTHAARLERLSAAGFDDDVTAKIKGPAGLDIGAKTPAEIAISVLAELVAAFRGKTTS
jgi:xanthine dehydrogenase accessory factor